MIFSIPLSVFTSRRGWGAMSRKIGLFVTPEEASPPEELTVMSARCNDSEDVASSIPGLVRAGFAQAILDPYVNAVHVPLLEERQLNPVYVAQLAKLQARDGSPLRNMI
jgi:membrane glycosyltransferase